MHGASVLRMTGSLATAPGPAVLKKLRSLDLWEIRVGRHRLFFCLVPGTNQLAVGALLEKTSRRIEMARLRQIEREVHRWRDALGRDR